MLTLDQILKETIWVAKMQGWRQTGTWEEIKHLSDSEDCRECDICASQPTEELQEFWDELYAHEGFITAQDFYPIYAKRHEKQKRVWTEQEIRSLIQTNDKVLYGALKKLYAEQTADEMECGNTKHRNGAGFNSIDASFLTSVSEFLLKTGFLTEKQKAVVRKKLIKYNKQLTRLANA